MSFDLPEPSRGEMGEFFENYLSFYREKAIAKLGSLDAEQQAASIVPSGWTPLELINHLAYMERRWFVWGFVGEDVDQPWGDHRDGRWNAEGLDQAAVVRHLRAVGARTTEVLRSHDLDAVARVGGRFTDFPPSLAWICFHVLQEYARHVGHLDIVVEIAGGDTGE